MRFDVFVLSQSLSERFIAAWTADGFRDYLAEESVAERAPLGLAAGRDVFSRLTSAPVPAMASPRPAHSTAATGPAPPDTTLGLEVTAGRDSGASESHAGVVAVPRSGPPSALSELLDRRPDMEALLRGALEECGMLYRAPWLMDELNTSDDYNPNI